MRRAQVSKEGQGTSDEQSRAGKAAGQDNQTCAKHRWVGRGRQQAASEAGRDRRRGRTIRCAPVTGQWGRADNKLRAGRRRTSSRQGGAGIVASEAGQNDASKGTCSMWCIRWGGSATSRCSRKKDRAGQDVARWGAHWPTNEARGQIRQGQ